MNTKKLKLSEAMRNGVTVLPDVAQVDCKVFDVEDGFIVGACALGFAFLGLYGYDGVSYVLRNNFESKTVYEALYRDYTDLKENVTVEDKKGGNVGLESFIFRCNDSRHMSIPEIAAELEARGF